MARVRDTFVNLGSGAMGSRIREQLTHWTDPSVFTQHDQWKGFLLAMVTALEADLLNMRNFLEEITKNKYSQGRLTLEDLEPDIFESNEKSKLSRIDQDFEAMLRLGAQMRDWDKDKFIAAARQGYRLGAERVAEFDKHINLAMERLTGGIAREIRDRRSSVPTHRPVLRKECARRNRHCQSTPRIEATYRECRVCSFAECDQEVGQRICSTVSKRTDAQRAVVKAAYMRVVPETYRKAMETQVDVDKVEPHTLEDKVLVFIRNNSSGVAPMDLGNIAPAETPELGLGGFNQRTMSSSHGGVGQLPRLQ